MIRAQPKHDGTVHQQGVPAIGTMMFKLPSAFLLIAIGVAVACSDDDGSDVVPKGPGMGGSAGSGMGGAAGSEAGSGGNAGGGAGGMSGNGGSGGSAGGPPDCTPLDAGALDAGDAGNGEPGDGGIGDASTDGGTSGVVSFATDVHPIFVARCGPCHVTQSSAGHNVGSDDIDVAYADAVAYSESILVRTNGGGMPPPFADPPNDCSGGPGDPGCLTVEEYALIQAWVAQCYPR